MWFIIFLLNCLFYPKLLLICFLQFFFIKCSNSFFTIKITNNICPLNRVLTPLITKNFFRSIWSISFCKNTFVFLFSCNIINLKSWIFIIRINIVFNIITRLNISRFHFNCSMICIIVIINNII